MKVISINWPMIASNAEYRQGIKKRPLPRTIWLGVLLCFAFSDSPDGDVEQVEQRWDELREECKHRRHDTNLDDMAFGQMRGQF